MDLGVGDYQPFEGLGTDDALGDQRFQMVLDHVPAVQRVHDQQRVGAVEQIFVLDPAVPVIQRRENTVVNSGANPGRQILGRAHLAGDLVDALEAEARDLAHQHVGVAFENRHHLATEPIHQRRHLVVGQPVPRQVGHGSVEGAVGDPNSLQCHDRLHRHLRCRCNRLGPGSNRGIEPNTEPVRDEPSLGRADALHVGVIG